jgi:hypothetical protein
MGGTRTFTPTTGDRASPGGSAASPDRVLRMPSGNPHPTTPADGLTAETDYGATGAATESSRKTARSARYSTLAGSTKVPSVSRL